MPAARMETVRRLTAEWNQLVDAATAGGADVPALPGDDVARRHRGDDRFDLAATARTANANRLVDWCAIIVKALNPNSVRQVVGEHAIGDGKRAVRLDRDRRNRLGLAA